MSDPAGCRPPPAGDGAASQRAGGVDDRLRDEDPVMPRDGKQPPGNDSLRSGALRWVSCIGPALRHPTEAPHVVALARQLGLELR